MNKLPLVALVGQTNAGKSSLLNRFARSRLAIVAREEGTTRDNVIAKIDDRFLLIDTAGLKAPNDAFEASIQGQIADAIAAAHLILLTLDSTKYPNQRDKQIAKQALKSQKPVFLVLNQSDKSTSLPDAEFRSLGIKPDHTFRSSATTGQGIKELKAAILSQLPHNSSSQPNPTPAVGNIKIALIGRPNVGKSSLFNTLGKKQQAIVSAKQGTTRDTNRIQIRYKNQDLEIFDTAGLRRPGKREVGVEKFSALRSLAAIEESDVCALLIDATEPHAKLDQALAGQIVAAGKGIILVITKSDLLTEPQTTDHILHQLEYDFNFLPYAPVLITSSKTGKNATKLFELAANIHHTRQQTLPTAELNKVLNDAIISHPPAGLKNTHPKPKYIVQTDTCPPWFVVHGHDLQLLHWSYQRYLERKLREHFPLSGTPIKFSFHNDQ